MNDFETEIRNKFPEWFIEKPQPIVNHNIYAKQPLYALPTILICLMVCFYCAAMHNKENKEYDQLEYSLNELEDKVDYNQDLLDLVAILHNENFAAIRRATNINHLIFIQRDWTINHMPRHLFLSEQDRHRIYEKYLDVRPKN